MSPNHSNNSRYHEAACLFRGKELRITCPWLTSTSRCSRYKGIHKTLSSNAAQISRGILISRVILINRGIVIKRVMPIEARRRIRYKTKALTIRKSEVFSPTTKTPWTGRPRNSGRLTSLSQNHECSNSYMNRSRLKTRKD